MKTKEVVRITISYTEEFTFYTLSDALMFLKTWKRGKEAESVKATIELVDVPIGVEESAPDLEPEHD